MKYIWVIIGAVIGSIAVLIMTYDPTYDKVMSREYKLKCNDRFIDVEMIDGKSDEMWFFKDGYAKNCEVIK